MEDTLKKAIQQSRRACLNALAIAMLFYAVSLAAIGGLEGLWMVVAAEGFLVVCIAFGLHEWFSGRSLILLMRLSRKSDHQVSSNYTNPTIQLPVKIAFQQAWLAFVVWVLVIVGFEVMLAWAKWITDWQAVVLGCVGVMSGCIHAVMQYSLAQNVLRSLGARLDLNADRSKDSVLGAASLSRKLISGFYLIFAVGMVIGSLMWMNRAREEAARAWMSHHAKIFRHMAVRSNEIARIKDPREQNDFIKTLLSETDWPKNYPLVLLNAGGQVVRSLGGPINPNPWFPKIVEQRTADWSELKTPFLFFSHPLPDRRHFLVAIGPDHLLYQALGTMDWRLLGFVVVMAACIWILMSIVRIHLKPLSSMSNFFRRADLSWSPETMPPVYDRELVDLTASLQKYVGLVKNLVGMTEEDLSGMATDNTALQQKVGELRDAGEQRIEIAEQTATSVTQMRASIQSISEQMESLREASNDCTSSMFEIDQSIREVSNSVANLQLRVEDTTLSTEQISGSIDEVSGNMDELAKVADETVASISIVDSSIKQVENSTTQTHRLSEDVTEYANKGAESVRLTIAGINEIQEVTREAREVIDRLGSQMEAVGKILTVIVDVAEQTNLLALNAAIIAAAAGEHGKGFAVVADEIKDLADRTSTSTKEIAGLIRSVQTDSRRAIDAMKRGTGAVKRGVDIAHSAGEALKQILQSVQQVNDMANDIATSTAEHSRITRNISRSMSKVSAMVREIKREVKEQSVTGEKMKKASTKIRDDAKFVSRSTSEQVQAVSEVSRNMGRISEMVSYVGRAMVEQSTGVDHVARVTEEVRDKFEKERIYFAELEEIVDRISRQSKQFYQQVVELQSSRKNEP